MKIDTAKTNAGSTNSNAWPAFAAAGAGLSAVLTAVGTFWDLTDNESSSAESLGEYAPVLGIIAVATAIVFGLVVRTATPASAPGRALSLAIVGLLSTAVFWAGLPAVLAAGSMACALVDRQDSRLSRRSLIAFVLSVVTIALAIIAAVAG